jgi:hypothetical protein
VTPDNIEAAIERTALSLGKNLQRSPSRLSDQALYREWLRLTALKGVEATDGRLRSPNALLQAQNRGSGEMTSTGLSIGMPKPRHLSGGLEQAMSMPTQSYAGSPQSSSGAVV